MGDDEVVRWMVFAHPFTEADGRRWLETHLPAEGSFVIAGPDDGLLGAVWVRDAGEGRGQIGYWTAPWARRRGAASEGLRQLVPRAFGLGYARLQLLVDPANAGSLAVAENAGFQREGVMRAWQELRDERPDLIMYSLLPRDME
jgi:RimJ/RimL family protein N-acetyltransferase